MSEVLPGAVASTLDPVTIRELHQRGFIIIPAAVPDEQLSTLASAYDAAVIAADATDVGHGATTRIHGQPSSSRWNAAIRVSAPWRDPACRYSGQRMVVPARAART